MPKKNILNQRFGRLTVIEEAPSDKNGNAMWKCRCDCGKEIITQGRRLRSGGVQSCGCLRLENSNKAAALRIIDLTNQRFGILTVIEKAIDHKDKNRGIIWKCLCDCGNYTYVRSHDLITGNTKSCGCQRNNSFGETKIKELLQNADILFIQEYTNNTCRYNTNYLARFDFYLPDYNTIIEYDGIQHTVVGNGNFDNIDKLTKTQQHDKIKNEWCMQNNIILIRIPYTHYKDLRLEDLLPETSTFIVSLESAASSSTRSD